MADLEVMQSRLADLSGRCDGKVDKDGGTIAGNLAVTGNLTASGVFTAGGRVLKTSATGRNTSPVTRTVDPDLLITLDANAYYEIRCMLHYWCATGGTGFVFGFVGPSGINGRWGMARDFITAGDVTAQGFTWADTTILATPAGVNAAALIMGTVWATSSGNFSVSWANNTAGVMVNLNPGSYLIAEKIG